MEITSPSSPTTSQTTLKGRKGTVINEIDPENISGKVKLENGSKIWSATADERIEEGTKVKISEVKGVHLKVEKVKKLKERLEERQKDTEELNVCPSCRSEIPVDSKECPECGTELMENEKNGEIGRDFEELKELIEEDIEENICPSCGSSIPIDSEKCPECGEELKVDKEKGKYFEELEELEELIEDFEE